MKNIILIVLFLSVTLFVNGETSISNISSPLPEISDVSGDLHIVHFKGVLHTWETPAGALIITCLPPFLTSCYTLIWSLGTDEMTVILNDENNTEIGVTSQPVVSNGTAGEEIHTFTR